MTDNEKQKLDEFSDMIVASLTENLAFVGKPTEEQKQQELKSIEELYPLYTPRLTLCPHCEYNGAYLTNKVNGDFWLTCFKCACFVD